MRISICLQAPLVNVNRRTQTHPPDDEFSPEYLSVLVVCGGLVRDSDWALLPEAVAARRRPVVSAAEDSEPLAD